MGQKVNPVSFRLMVNKNWRSKWFSERNYATILAQDLSIRKTIKLKLGRTAGINVVEIERNAQELVVNIHTAKPGILIGRSGQGITDLKDLILKNLNKIYVSPISINKKPAKKEPATKIKINVIEVKNPDMCANLVAQNIATQLEKRVSYRRAVKMSIEKILHHREVKGVKVNVSGRLGGVDIARREKFIDGSIPLGTLRSLIDYAQVDAYTTFGTIGIKVWIYKK